MEMTLEVLVVPVADVGTAKDFYAGKLTQGAQMEPGTLKGPQLVVADLRSTREELAARGVAVSEVQVVEGGPPRPAAPDDQLDYRGFVFFEDPDGNGWAIQQLSQPLAERAAALAAAEGPRGAPAGC